MASMSQKHNPTLLSQLYNSTIKSIFEYSCICIITAANVHLRKLQLIQNEALRIILKVPAYMPVARMNDCGGQINVKEHLCSIAAERIRRLVQSSRQVRQTCDNYKKIRQSSYNQSPLDTIQF